MGLYFPANRLNGVKQIILKSNELNTKTAFMDS